MYMSSFLIVDAKEQGGKGGIVSDKRVANYRGWFKRF